MNVAATKLKVFVFAAVLAGLAGWLYAHFQRSVAPGPFGVNAGIEYLLMAVVGGAGRVYGAILGATAITFLRDQLQNILPALVGSARQLRNRRIRRGAGVRAAGGAERPVADPVRSSARGEAGAAPPEHQPPASARSRARRAAARRRIGVQELRRAGRGERRRLRRAGRRDRRPDRPERRGQEHDLQPDLRRPDAEQRRKSAFAARRSPGQRRSRSPRAASDAPSSTRISSPT